MLCLVAQSCPTLCDPMECSLPGSTVHGNSPGKNTGVGCHALLQGTSSQGNELTSPAIAGRFFIILATREAQEYWIYMHTYRYRYRYTHISNYTYIQVTLYIHM